MEIQRNRYSLGQSSVNLCVLERQFASGKFPEIEIFTEINIKEKPNAYNAERTPIKRRYRDGAANSNYETVRMDVVVSLLLLLLFLLWIVAVNFPILLPTPC